MAGHPSQDSGDRTYKTEQSERNDEDMTELGRKARTRVLGRIVGTRQPRQNSRRGQSGKVR
jgi:hypothetical protein